MKLSIKELVFIVMAMVAVAFYMGFNKTIETRPMTVEEYERPSGLHKNQTVAPSEGNVIINGEPVLMTIHSGTLSPFNMAKGALIGGVGMRLLLFLLKRRKKS